MAEVLNRSDAFCWSISKIADGFGMDRRTVSKKLQEAGVTPAGQRRGNAIYDLASVGPALYGISGPSSAQDPDRMLPQDRRAWFQSENERLKLEQECQLLIPRDEVHREMAELAKAVVRVLDNIPDVLERDTALAPEQVQRVQSLLDDLRDDLARQAMPHAESEVK